MDKDDAAVRGGTGWRRFAGRYAMTAALVVLAVLARRWLVGSFGPMPLFITFYPAVLIAAAIAGGGPGIVATILSSLAASYWFIEPYGSFAIQSMNEAIALGIFIGVGLVLSLLLERLRRLQWIKAVNAAQEQELALLNMGNLVVLDLDNRIVRWSSGCHRLYGFEAAETKGRDADDLLQTRSAQPLELIRRDLMTHNHWEGEFTRRRKDGTELSLAILLALRRDEKGQPTAILEVSTDITSLKDAERTIHESKERHRDILRTAMDGIIMADQDGRLMDVNEAYCRMSGYDSLELLTMSIVDLAVVKSANTVTERFRKIMELGDSVFETRHHRKDGTVFDVEVSAMYRPTNGGHFVFFIRDITERKFKEAVQQQTGHMIQLASTHSDLHQCVSALTAIMHDLSGCEAVGIRLRAGDDYPYFETRGFPPEFVQVENRLCSHDQDGSILRDGAGDPVLECMCGNILRGRLDHSRPFFSDRGSFWTNSTTALLAETGNEADRQARTCNRCNGEGYESVALIPMHAGNAIIGLMQFNDHRKDRFTDALIGALEEIADKVALALTGRQAENELHRREMLHHDMLNSIPDMIWLKDPKGVILSCNKQFERLYGATAADIIGKTSYNWIDKAMADLVSDHDRQALEAGGPVNHEVWVPFADGHVAYIITTRTPMFDTDGNIIGILGVGRDITARKRLEETQEFLLTCGLPGHEEGLLKSLARYLAEALKIDSVRIDRLLEDNLTAETLAFYFDGNFENNITYALHDTPSGAVVGQTICSFPRDVRHLFPNDTVLNEMVAESYVGTTLWSTDGKPIGLIAVIGRSALADTSLAEAILKVVAIRAASELERRHAEKEKADLEAQLSQAQKMESVGRLAGGVAHDFNNMLSVIMGNTYLALEKSQHDPALQAHIKEIGKAAERSADLTRQLLAFARKQIIATKVLDLNETVASMLKMLQRLIGEDIDLVWKPTADLWAVKLDPAQIDQILANLCVNARDSIKDVGKITIETGNISIDDDYCAHHAGFSSGEYVHLTVSDSGHGMDKVTLSHIFEPFFTTKGTGEGTGLGLSTVYGAVKQNNGFVNVYSEPGTGTTFSIYLPRHADTAVKAPVKSAVAPIPQGHEHILLVEDEPSILNMIVAILTMQGFTVSAASTPSNALRIAEEHADEIHLLITDVVMPEMNGRELARQVQARHPKIRCLFMSGYTANVIAHHGVLDDGVYFIQKPFSVPAFATKVRDVLEDTR